MKSCVICISVNSSTQQQRQQQQHQWTFGEFRSKFSSSYNCAACGWCVFCVYSPPGSLPILICMYTCGAMWPTTTHDFYLPIYILHIKVNFFLAFPPTQINYYNIIICCGVYENIIFFFHFYDFKTTTTTTLKCAARYINICLRCCRLLAQKIRIGVVRYTTVCSAGLCDGLCVYNLRIGMFMPPSCHLPIF